MKKNHKNLRQTDSKLCLKKREQNKEGNRKKRRNNK